MSKDFSLWLWEADRYNSQYQDVDSYHILKTFRYMPKTGYDNKAIRIAAKTVADWSQDILDKKDADNDDDLLMSYVETAQRGNEGNFSILSYNSLPESNYLYYSLLETIIKKSQELNLIIMLDMYGTEIFIYPDGSSAPFPNYVDYVLTEKQKAEKVKNRYHQDLTFNDVMNMPPPNTVKQGRIFMETCIKEYANRNGIIYQGKTRKIIYDDMASFQLVLNNICVCVDITMDRRGGVIHYINFEIEPAYSGLSCDNLRYELPPQKLTTFEPSADSNYHIHPKMLWTTLNTIQMHFFYPWPKNYLEIQKTTKGIYEILCVYLDIVFGAIKPNQNYLEFLNNIYVDKNNGLHNYFWSDVTDKFVQNKDSVPRSLTLLTVHRMRMLGVMAILLHPKLPDMLNDLLTQVTLDFNRVKKEFESGYGFVKNLQNLEASQDFFDLIIKVYEEGLKGINYPSFAELDRLEGFL